MKKLITLITFILFTGTFYAQVNYSTDQRLVGDNVDYGLGIHVGAFDCNSWVKYPYTIGADFQFNYVPDVMKKWFIGTEVGAFYAGSGADKFGRKTSGMYADFTFYPGLSFPVGSNYMEEDNATLRYKKMAESRKFRVGMGFTIATPLYKNSSGINTNLKTIKTGFGFSFRTSYDLPKRLTIFGDATRISRDLDGLARESSASLEPYVSNNHKVTYYYKLGILWNFVR